MSLLLENDKCIRQLVSESDIEKVRGYDGIIIFGAGESGSYLCFVLKSFGIRPDCFCDNYPGKQGKVKDGLMVYSFDEALSHYPEACICIGSLWADEIKKQIAEEKPDYCRCTFDILSPMVWELKQKALYAAETEYINGNISGFHALYAGLADSRSREVLEGILNFRLTRDKKFLKAVYCNKEEYFDEDIIPDEIFHDEGVFIDGGAFDGDTVKKLLRIHADNKLACHCYEPEAENFARLQDYLFTIRGGVETYAHRAGLYDVKTKNASVEGDSLGAGVVNSSRGSLALERIDDLEDKRPVRFIKLDIEGAERNALEGGYCRISMDRPVLAVCAYHMQDDLLVLAGCMRKLSHYSIFLRHYMEAASETVMYAVPDELLK